MVWRWNYDGGSGGTATSSVVVINSDTANTDGGTGSVVIHTSAWNCTVSADTSNTIDAWWDPWQPWGNTSTSVATSATWTGADNLAWSVHRETEEEKKARLEQQKKEAEERRQAAQRAQELLLRHLSRWQRWEYRKKGFFTVVTKRKHRYRIARARDHNVIRVNKRGKQLRCYCISIYQTWVPTEDIMLAQKLLLEADEDVFLQTANDWSVRTAKGFRRAA